MSEAIEALKSLEPVHLSEIIEDEMRARGWSLDDLVMNMGPHFSEEEWGITKLSWEFFFSCREMRDVVLGDVMAQQLSTAFDVSPIFFTTLHDSWRKWQPASPETELSVMKGIGRR